MSIHECAKRMVADMELSKNFSIAIDPLEGRDVSEDIYRWAFR